jgi:hypothetical protein
MTLAQANVMATAAGLPALPEKAPAREIESGAGQSCATCQRALPWADFLQQRGSPTGYTDRCRACLTARVDRSFTFKVKGHAPRAVGQTARDEAHYSAYLSASRA